MSENKAAKRQRESNGEAEQFDRFEQLTRRLLAVPKQEAKEAERKEREQKARKNGR